MPWLIWWIAVTAFPQETTEVEVPTVVVLPPLLDVFDGLAVRAERIASETFAEERAVRFLPDALEESVGVGLQRTGPGQGSPFLRGFTGFRTLIILDGFRFNHSAWREGPNQYLATIDSELVDHMDVYFGSGGVSYGPDAVGGTLVVESRAAGPFLPGRDHTGFLALRLSSAEQSIVTHGAGGGRAGRASYRVGATYRNYGNLDGGRHIGEQRGTAYDGSAGDVKLAWQLADHSHVEFAHQLDRQHDVPRTHRTQEGINWHGATHGNEIRRDLSHDRDFTFGRLNWAEEGLFDRVQAGLGYHSQQEERDRIRADGRRDLQGFDVDTLGGFLKLESDSPIGQLRYGFDHYHDEINSFRRDYDANGTLTAERIQGPVGDDSSYDLFGVFLQEQSDLPGDFVLTAGGRYSRARAEAGRVQDPVNSNNTISLSDRFEALSGELRLEKLWQPALRTYVATARSVRMPNLSDLTRLDSARSGEVETPSPGLRPERFTSVELGTSWHSQPLEVELAGYLTFIHNMILRFPTGNVIDGENEVQKANSGEGRIKGIDLRVLYRYDEAWSAGADLSYIRGDVDTPVSPTASQTEPLSRVPPLRSNLKLRWDDPDSSIWVEGLMTVADGQGRLSSRDQSDTQRIPPGGTPGYTIYGLRGGFEPLDNLRVTLVLENLTNRDYRLHGSGVNEPGTNVILSLRYRF